MASQNLGKMFRGDDKVVQFTLPATTLPSDGVASFSFWFTAKLQISDTDTAAQWQKVGTPGNLGPFSIAAAGGAGVDAVVNCALVPADTNQLPDYDVVLTWDLQVKDAAGHETTSASGTLTVQPDVTRAS